jgi:Holliday junction resolvase RusA-like endonuclease
MREILHLHIAGEPMAVQSVRAVRMGNGIRTFQPKKVEDWKSYVRLSINNQLPEDWVVLDRALAVKYVLKFPPLKSMRKKELKRIEDGETVYKPKKPDFDNCLKGLNDCLSGIVWRDDALVVRASVSKIYALNPEIEVVIYEED